MLTSQASAWNIGFGATPDSDADGIPDDVDQCVDEAEDLDGFEDDDGCPEEGSGEICADVTGDGIVTAADISRIARHLGIGNGRGGGNPSEFPPELDLNDDGVIDPLDLQIAIEQRGHACGS